MSAYLYIEPALQSFGSFEDERLAGFTERHSFQMPILALTPADSLSQEIAARPAAGIVFGMATGLPSKLVLRLAAQTLRRGRSVFLYWPMEAAIEVVDRERLGSLWRHWLAYNVGRRVLSLLVRLRAARRPAAGEAAAVAQAEASGPVSAGLDFVATDFECTKAHLLGGIDEIRRLTAMIGQIDETLGSLRAQLASNAGADSFGSDILRAAEHAASLRASAQSLQAHMDGGETALNRIGESLEQLRQTARQSLSLAPPSARAADADSAAVDSYRRELAALRDVLSPVRFEVAAAPSSTLPLPGAGVYIRTDYWAQLVSGGSYGHTCYVAKELAAVTGDFTCLMASHFALLDELGLRQEVIQPAHRNSSEIDLIKADPFYYEALRARLEKLRPAYIYERLCLGNFAVARLSRDLGIPYIVEYNGSELSMRRSFGSGPYVHEDLFLQAEELAFKQASAINVISEHVRDDVVRRGADPAKVLVNPNGVDCDEYAPASVEERREIRASVGLGNEPVIGFIGTFGGWHGIDVLAAALPAICQGAPDAKFLLIGDGNLKPVMIDAIRRHGLQARVVDVGRTEQRAGARLLKAADIYVSPHSSHMVDSPFFGSPTKLFEYMALGGGIVASDLEQLGIVMSPALRPADFLSGKVIVGNERGVLCKPGDVDEFTSGVLALLRDPDAAIALGRNARAAALAQYSWRQHVSRIWDHIVALDSATVREDAAPRSLEMQG
jgi:glycosyltransferase involved in cell wall biosynthesis